MRARARSVMLAGLTLAAGAAAAVSATASAAPADDTPPPIVEDYAYPGAAKIFQERALTLISGDGHILFAACGSGAAMLEVHAYNSADHGPDSGHYCFTVTGSTGYLRLQVPYAYQVKGDSHTVQATVEINGKNSTVPIAKNGWTGVGEGAGTDPATLLELRASS
ncbi:hypothetical protein [Amycolatopsis sp. WGS_07]|uniref:hypothetical protein n=1 Tax=Amycolatopsis sp. WGS_07 TaxID=3076764 RepID=UPI0038737407